MVRIKKRFSLVILGVFMKFTCFNAQVMWNVLDKYGAINASTLQEAVDAAIAERAINPDQDITLQLTAGTYYLNKQIILSGFNKNGVGWLIIQGQGEDNTVLVDTEYKSDTDVTFLFENPYRIKLCNLTLQGERLTHSQGTIVRVVGQDIDIQLDEGYPIPNDLFEIETNKANKIRIMADTDLNSPHYVEGDDNDHQSNRWTFQGDVDYDGVPQTRPFLVVGRVWRFRLASSDPHPFKTGLRVGVSSKSNRSNWALFKGDGADVVVENVLMMRLGRVKFRHGWERIRFTNVKIKRSLVNGKKAFYSTDAGPQFGHDSDDKPISDLIVENCDFRGTVDDGSAFQRVESGLVTHNRWEDGGGTLVGINCSSELKFIDNVHYHCPLEDERPGKVDFKGAYNPVVQYNNDGVPVTLCWMPGARSEIHDVYLGTSFPLSLVSSETGTTYGIPANLKSNTTYYWMVYERNVTERLGVNESDIWTFTTPDNCTIIDTSEENTVTLYPNPVLDVLYVRGIEDDGESISVLSASGVDVTNSLTINYCLPNILTIKTASLTPGTYIIKTRKKSYKFIKLNFL